MSKYFTVRPEGRHIFNQMSDLVNQKLELFKTPWSHEKQVQFNELECQILKLDSELEPYKCYSQY